MAVLNGFLPWCQSGKIKILINIEASRGAGAQNVTVKSTVCGFDPDSARGNEIFIYIYI